jgi:hypothetical protein
MRGVSSGETLVSSLSAQNRAACRQQAARNARAGRRLQRRDLAIGDDQTMTQLTLALAFALAMTRPSLAQTLTCVG